MYQVKIIDGTHCKIVNNETGKEYEATGSWHARTLNGVYKYHEYYVFTNKLNTAKYPELEELKTKAPRTLEHKWKVEPKEGAGNEWWTRVADWKKIHGGRLNEVCEELTKSNSRSKIDLNAIADLF